MGVGYFIYMFLHISFCENISNGKVAKRCVLALFLEIHLCRFWYLKRSWVQLQFSPKLIIVPHKTLSNNKTGTMYLQATIYGWRAQNWIHTFLDIKSGEDTFQGGGWYMYNVETLLEFQTVRITVLHINKLFQTDMCYACALFKSFYMLEE